MGKWMGTVLILIGAAFLTRLIPFSAFFRNVDTMIHEFGHALVTLLLSGKVMYIYLYPNHSGVTYSSVAAAWKMIPIALAGYTTASLFAMFMFYSYRRGKQALGLQGITLLAGLCLLLFVRNSFGVLWILGFMVINVIVLLLGSKVRNVYYLLVSFLTLEESVSGPFSLFLQSMITPGQSGDATNLSKYTILPAPAWALLFFLFSLWCGKYAVQWFLGKGKRHRTEKSFPS